mmetsp:Transcript_20424/g.56831  ORF Transcript_20424/g.56831 Transcript_20424/m.56831 type:complete len:228 (-) Transcript_20424:683-1366(-)
MCLPTEKKLCGCELCDNKCNSFQQQLCSAASIIRSLVISRSSSKLQQRRHMRRSVPNLLKQILQLGGRRKFSKIILQVHPVDTTQHKHAVEIDGIRTGDVMMQRIANVTHSFLRDAELLLQPFHRATERTSIRFAKVQRGPSQRALVVIGNRSGHVQYGAIRIDGNEIRIHAQHRNGSFGASLEDWHDDLLHLARQYVVSQGLAFVGFAVLVSRQDDFVAMQDDDVG